MWAVIISAGFYFAYELYIKLSTRRLQKKYGIQEKENDLSRRGREKYWGDSGSYRRAIYGNEISRSSGQTESTGRAVLETTDISSTGKDKPKHKRPRFLRRR